MKNNYNKYPYTKIDGEIYEGWKSITSILNSRLTGVNFILSIEKYNGIRDSEVERAIALQWPNAEIVYTKLMFKSSEDIQIMTNKYVGEDEIFGFLSSMDILDYFDIVKMTEFRDRIFKRRNPIIIYGPGTSYLCDNPDLTIYLDMTRWELQMRFRKHEVSALGFDNSDESASRQYKRGYFNDWPVLDKHKQSLFNRIDFWIDTKLEDYPKMISKDTFYRCIDSLTNRPFRLVPFFDPSPWGGKWMEEKFCLDKKQANYGWCFDCVPEENSLLFKINNQFFEMPSMNLVFIKAKELLGDKILKHFGRNFPIRFDFLDTIGGGNLSLQVHPTNDYIKSCFGMSYTQDESYYLLDAEQDAKVYLGLKKDIDPRKMISELEEAHRDNKNFKPDKYVNCIPAKKHDHFLIPNGTIHCSGAGSMVLEISSTPSIFTFKMWDWQRLGLDGKPRSINIRHATSVIDWNRDTDFVNTELVNCVIPIAEGDGWKEEKTGLHNIEFIETRRHWFTKKVEHNTNGTVNVLNLIEGESAIVESPDDQFEPYVVHYAETFIIPACVGKYTIRPFDSSRKELMGTIKAYVRL